MRKVLWLSLMGVLALAVTGGIAVAAKRAADTKAVSATFTAAAAEGLKSRTCTGVDGTYQFRHGQYKGTAVSDDARLNGPITLRLESVYNQTEKLGTVTGTVRFSTGEDDGKGLGHVHAVNSDGKLTGIVIGGIGRPHGKLIANFSAELGATGLTAGKIGSGTPASTAVVLQAQCKKSSSGESQGTLRIAKGEITALSATALSVKVGDVTVTFVVTEAVSKQVTDLALAVGSKVQVTYSVKGDSKVLLKLRKA